MTIAAALLTTAVLVSVALADTVNFDNSQDRRAAARLDGYQDWQWDREMDN